MTSPIRRPKTNRGTTISAGRNKGQRGQQMRRKPLSKAPSPVDSPIGKPRPQPVLPKAKAQVTIGAPIGTRAIGDPASAFTGPTVPRGTPASSLQAKQGTSSTSVSRQAPANPAMGSKPSYSGGRPPKAPSVGGRPRSVPGTSAPLFQKTSSIRSDTTSRRAPSRRR